MPRAVHWGAGLAASAVLHAGAAGLFVATYDPAPPPPQSGPESQFQLETVTAPTQDVAAQPAVGDEANSTAAESTPVSAGSIPQSTATPLAATGQTAQALAAPGAVVAADAPSAAPLAAVQAPGAPLAAVVSDAPALATTTPAAVSAVAASLTATALAPAPPPTPTALAAAQPSATTALASVQPSVATARPVAQPTTAIALASSLPPAATARASAPTTTALAPAPAPTTSALAPALPTSATTSAQNPAGTAAVVANPDAPQLASLAADGPVAAEPTLPATTAKADTAWQFGDRLVTDPAALATIQAFMAPADINNAADIKDNLSDVLASIPCARISATFLPETGTLDIQGHIPDPNMRDTVLAAMQAQVGDGIPVTANLLHLPSPQCAALTGISNVGLPQSTDQFTNDRLIGQSAHARDYRYSEGQRLQFDLVAPDYDAYVYVDYFAADGSVIHLVPNDIIPLERLPAKSLIGVGTDVPGKPGLRITIAPPFGQEIAVAFAASHRLFEGLRPTVEPAEPYLAYLTEQVAVARAANPDFKGEWVYFHMTTTPATQ